MDSNMMVDEGTTRGNHRQCDLHYFLFAIKVTQEMNDNPGFIRFYRRHSCTLYLGNYLIEQ